MTELRADRMTPLRQSLAGMTQLAGQPDVRQGMLLGEDGALLNVWQ